MLQHRSCKKLSLILLLALLGPLLQCKQKDKRTDFLLPEVKDAQESLLVEAGDSSQAAFSPDGQRLLFVSRGRPGHNHAQIYEKDLKSGQETRITFQNGDTSHPTYGPRGEWILYSSSTDELKENPPLLKPSTTSANLPAAFQEPTEVYLHYLKGLEIVRLTNVPGFDGEARFSPDGQTLFWTRARGERLEILSMNRATKATRTLKNLGVNPALYTISNDNKWKAWIDWDASYGVAQLKVQKGNGKPSEIIPDLVVPKADLAFSPDSKWLLWAQMNSETSTYQLWTLELETSCVRRISANDDGDRRHPMLSPDSQRLVYTIQRKGRSRIAQVGFASPTGPCVAQP